MLEFLVATRMKTDKLRLVAKGKLERALRMTKSAKVFR